MSRAVRRWTTMAGIGVSLAAVFALVPVTQARASTNQISIFQDDPRLDADPAGTLARMRLLGAQVVRVSVPWFYIAPDVNSKKPPRNFDATNPAAYPAANWALWDAIATDAKKDGMTVDFDLLGGAPRWALGPGRPAGNTNPNWEPNAADFGQFVRAIGTRYSGNYDPTTGQLAPGNPDDLPRVNFWSVWNEPDYGPSLAPQGVPGHLTIENSPRMYRNLLDAAWAGLEATGHTPATDTIIWGELAPRGESYWGVFSGMTPLDFLRNLYCVGSNYHELRGTAARERGCPTTAAGSRAFRAQNPALFDATGVSDHPYMRWYAPNHEIDPDPVNHLSTRDYTSLGVIGNLTRALDRLVGVYGSRTRFPVYDTEFGYITAPPKHSPDPDVHSSKVYYLSPATAAYYINWAEYISWRNPRVRSFDQYLLYDIERPTKANDWGGFASGLLTWTGAQKATYYAWRLPLYLPTTTARKGQALEVWGCVRPAAFGVLDTGSPQTAQLQFAPGSSKQFTTIQTVTIGAGASCYFDLHLTFPSSGTLRLAYTYPPGDLQLGNGAIVLSRTVRVTVR
ncbi:MAG TPA: hypothetical protein VMF57_00885 [Solirubrobacteraceae bacterium]|nr:hypothetical protein [Solirubrobacteraceae bacterium]